MSSSVDVQTAPQPSVPQDERVVRRSLLSRLLTRPEVGAALGAIVIFVVFFSVAPPFRGASALATVLYVSSTFGIPGILTGTMYSSSFRSPARK